METRTALAPNELYALLVREFDHIRPQACTECSMPRPIPSRRIFAESPNWFCPLPLNCQYNCATHMAWLLGHYTQQYDLKRAEKRVAATA